MRCIINDLVRRQTILQQLYNKYGHKEQKDIYQQVVDSYR